MGSSHHGFAVSVSSQTSYTLLEQVRAADQQAWERFVDVYGPTLYGWCRSAGLPDADTADVIQDTFRAVASGIERFERTPDRQGAFTAWLWTVTQNRIKNHWQRRVSKDRADGGSDAQQLLAELPDPFADLSDTKSTVGETSIVLRTAELVRPEFTETTWQAFWRVAVDDQRTDLVATQLSISVAAVRQAAYRVRKRLREELQDVISDQS